MEQVANRTARHMVQEERRHAAEALRKSEASLETAKIDGERQLAEEKESVVQHLF